MNAKPTLGRKAMSAATFNRDSIAATYAKRHKETDPAIRAIHYLPTGAPPNEICLVEVKEAITGTAGPEPIGFGVDFGAKGAKPGLPVDLAQRHDHHRFGTLK
jgi:hypothetical protein